MISLVFTCNDMPVSRMIRSATHSVCSHFAIVIDNRIVFHSNFKGAHVEFLPSFLKHNTICYQLDLLLTPQQEEDIYQECLKYDGKPYDFGAFFYLIWCFIKNKLFKTPFAKQNLWSDRDYVMCVELAKILQVIGIDIKDLDLYLPQNLYSNLRLKIAQKGLLLDGKAWPGSN